MLTVYDRKADCCGCTACKSICPTGAISMEADHEGFLYPRIDPPLCIDCGLCRKVCAFQMGYDRSGNFDMPAVFAAKHRSDEVRRRSSSGGAFTAASDHMLAKGGVVYGAAFAEGFRVVHRRAETAEGKDAFRGSKYVQSDPEGTFMGVKDDLDGGRQVLFTGTPCQCAGLRRFLETAGTDASSLLAVDIICYGTPSYKLFKDFIAYLEESEGEKVVDFRFRSKENGWGSTEAAVFEGGRVDFKSRRSQLYRKLFFSNLCLRPACYECRYTNLVRPSDITMADFWGIEEVLPEFRDELGVSLILVNTAKGRVACSGMLGDLVTIESSVEACLAKQPALKAPATMNPLRQAFWEDYGRSGFRYALDKYIGIDSSAVKKPAGG